ncbi:MAG: hypothetical protein QOJ46_1049 [bacterium]|jgi:hypothetical protein
MELIAYDGRVFAPVAFEGSGPPPTGRWSQHDDVVMAEFSGAHLRAGRLVGRCRDDGTLDLAYCQVMADGRVVSGRCVSSPHVLPDGRLRLTERWRRDDGSSGISEIEEVRT